MKEKGERKVRSDRKRQISPLVIPSLHETLHRIAFVTDLPVKIAGEQLIEEGLQTEKVMGVLAKHFRRSYEFSEGNLFLGDPGLQPYRLKYPVKKRIYLRFTNSISEQLDHLAFSLDSSSSTAAGFLLDVSLKTEEIIVPFMKRYMPPTLTPKQIKELREIADYIYATNPYQKPLSAGRFLAYVYMGIVEGTQQIKKSLDRWT